MNRVAWVARGGVVLTGFSLATFLTLSSAKMRGSALWQGLVPPASAGQKGAFYELTQLNVVNDVIKNIGERYVDPKRVRSRDMFLSALNYVQRDVPQIIVMHEEGSNIARVRIDAKERDFRVDNVIGPWDLSARLKEVFVFVEEQLKGTDVDLRDIEYAACNGMLHTLDPHSVLLSPDAFKDMNATTTGQFGGLGIVISIRDQVLTVMNPMPGTPAGRVGLKKYDRILRIDGEATLNMGLPEAVNHLRGKPGTDVTIYVHRDGPEGWQGTRPFKLTRELIHVKSVDFQPLEGNIGYVRLKHFQASTADELDKALTTLREKGELKGLVLDLRGNPGGLLDQAAKVVDKFVASGPIVATVGNAGEGRDEKHAKEAGTEPNYPIAVLVSGTSASASEIVAGALKNHDRAVIIGETTFGKGSVQQIFGDLPDKAALKLTIAQYLTEPGDISIQGTGVTPDVALDPMTVDEKEMDLTVDSNYLKERDLSRSLSNARAREGQKPLESLRYNLPPKERADWRERGGDPDDNFVADFPIRFARDFVAKAPAGKRVDQMRAAKNFIGDIRGQELAKLTSDFKTINLDWNAPADGPAAPAPEVLEAKVETDRQTNEFRAGDPMTLKVTVTNKGAVPLYRLHAVTKSDSYYFDNKELAFGKLDPGKTLVATVPLGFCETDGYKVGSTATLPKDAPRVCKIPREALTRADGIKVQFDEAFGHAPKPVELRATVRSLERPIFSYSYQVVDNRSGNGDGKVQKGEDLTMFVTIKNVGLGRSFETQANLKNLSGDGVLLHEGRFDISNMEPGETKRVSFSFEVQKSLAENEARVELSVADRDLRESVVERIRLPIQAASTITAASGAVHAKAGGAALFESPDAKSRSVGKLTGGATLQGRSDEFVKVQIAPNRFAFARSKDVDDGNAAPAFEDSVKHAPPTIEVAPLSLATRDSHVLLKGTTTDGEQLIDAFIFVGNKKLFYRSNKGGSDPRKMNFEADLPLRDGANVITIVSRETPETTSRKTLVIRRDGPSGELLATPKGEEDLLSGFADGDRD